MTRSSAISSVGRDCPVCGESILVWRTEANRLKDGRWSCPNCQSILDRCPHWLSWFYMLTVLPLVEVPHYFGSLGLIPRLIATGVLAFIVWCLEQRLQSYRVVSRRNPHFCKACRYDFRPLGRVLPDTCPGCGEPTDPLGRKRENAEALGKM
ncbi:MAG: hypothetical protein GC164_02695 [Phycisphaera sp.]|nr:hypothetical protein [Phycisphaera sp.]